MAAMLTLLSSATSSATGPAVEILAGRRVAFTATSSGGSVGVMFLQGSFDGVNWFGLAAPANAAQVGAYAETNVVANYVRVVYDDQGKTGAASVYALQPDISD